MKSEIYTLTITLVDYQNGSTTRVIAASYSQDEIIQQKEYQEKTFTPSMITKEIKLSIDKVVVC